MSQDDIRTRRLEWIRDGSVWLVGLSSGALILSVTYFFDKFKQQPKAACLLFLAWGLLLIAAGAGVFTAFSTWKDLKPAPQNSTEEELPLGSWVATCYTVMMWTFLGGFVALIIALILNVFRPLPQTEKHTIELLIPSDVTINLTATSSQHAPSKTSPNHKPQPSPTSSNQVPLTNTTSQAKP